MSELIDRDAVREFIKSYRHSTDVVYHMEKHLYEVPTINAVPVVHGEWIGERLPASNGGTYGIRRCSRCKAYCLETAYDWDYCPNCGARMDGKEQS